MKTVDDPEQTFAFPFSVQWVPCYSWTIQALPWTPSRMIALNEICGRNHFILVQLQGQKEVLPPTLRRLMG